MMNMDLPADKRNARALARLVSRRDAIARLIGESGIAIAKMRPRLKAQVIAQLNQKLQNVKRNNDIRAKLEAAAVHVLDWTARLFALQLVGHDAVDDICRRLLRVSPNASESKSLLEIELLCHFATQIRPWLSENERSSFFSRFNSEINAVKLRGDFPELLEHIDSFVSGSPTTSNNNNNNNNNNNSAATLASASPPPPKALPAAAAAAAVAPGAQLNPTKTANLVASDNLSSSGAKNVKNNNGANDDDQQQEASNNNVANIDDQINPINVLNDTFPESNGQVFSSASGGSDNNNANNNNGNGNNANNNNNPTSQRKRSRAEEKLNSMLVSDPSRVFVDLTLKLGEGGFGAVYHGTFDGCLVAIKIPFKSGDAADAEILREALHMLKVKSPTCVACLGIVRLPQLQHKFALIAERCICSVSALRDVLDRQQKALQHQMSNSVTNSNNNAALGSVTAQRPSSPPSSPFYAFTPAETFSILQSVVRGVLVLHSTAKIVHRDLKPQNFLIVVEQTTGRIITKLNDFGSCKRDAGATHDTSSAAATMTSNANLGAHGATRIFTAPELRGTGENSGGVRATPASDVYAIGVTMFFMLSGADPGVVYEVTANRVNRLPLSEPIKKLVMECVDEEAQYRPTVPVLLRRVEELVQQYPLTVADNARLIEAARSVPVQLQQAQQPGQPNQQQQQQPAMLSRSAVYRPFDDTGASAQVTPDNG